MMCQIVPSFSICRGRYGPIPLQTSGRATRSRPTLIATVEDSVTTSIYDQALHWTNVRKNSAQLRHSPSDARTSSKLRLA